MPHSAPQFRPPRVRAKQSAKKNPLYLSKQWRALRGRILVRDAYICQVCFEIVTGRRAHVDHIVELVDGGDPFEPSNLRCLCDRCNGRKAKMMQSLREG